jgi:hypothetical protein
VLEDPSTVASTTLAEFDLPLGADANGRAGPDLFEVAQAITATTAGIYRIDWGPGYGNLHLTWNRAAGMGIGSCRLEMDDPLLGPIGPFDHSFEVLEYSGVLAYTPQTDSIGGTLQAGNPQTPSEVLEGTLTLRRDANDRFNRLLALPGTWISQDLSFDFAEFPLTRAASEPTVYRGIVPSASGTRSSWRISITDTNDANQNGIPDLSDDPANLPPPRRPVLSLEWTSNELSLRLTGDTGRTHQLQEASRPDAITWGTVRIFTLQRDPETITLPMPTNSPTFWRVVAQ